MCRLTLTLIMVTGAALAGCGGESSSGQLGDALNWQESENSTPSCGNGVLDEFEQCDDGNADDNDGCTTWCEICPPHDGRPYCGDGKLDPGEECDGGDGDWFNCDAQCKYEHWCGNGVVDEGEQCDDMNAEEGDGCDGDCRCESNQCPEPRNPTPPRNPGNPDPGNNPGEPDPANPGGNDPGQNDPGQNDPGQGNPGQSDPGGDVCGDGVIGESEVCDDGNTRNNDYCSSDCSEERVVQL